MKLGTTKHTTMTHTGDLPYPEHCVASVQVLCLLCKAKTSSTETAYLSKAGGIIVVTSSGCKSQHSFKWNDCCSKCYS